MSKSKVSDGELVHNWQQGDDDAFAELYERYRLPLYSYIHKLLPGQNAQVDDLYQRTWVKAIDQLPRYTDQGKFLSWMFRIAHNLAIDHFRREARREHVALDERIAGEQHLPWAEMDRVALAEQVGRCVEQLAPEQREVVLMRKQGISFKEIAEVQATSVNTVLGRMHYAVKHLRRMLSDWQVES